MNPTSAWTSDEFESEFRSKLLTHHCFMGSPLFQESFVETAKQELSDARKAQADLEDEARRAGVPPGWIRLDDED